jgi:hypothetical protein
MTTLIILDAQVLDRQPSYLTCNYKLFANCVAKINTRLLDFMVSSRHGHVDDLDTHAHLGEQWLMGCCWLHIQDTNLGEKLN